MEIQDKEHVAKIANWMWPNSMRPNQVTDEVAAVVGKAFEAAMRKGKLINLLPRPAGFIPGPTWLISEGVKAFWRRRSGRIPEMARRAAALQWRTEYEMAKLGI